MYIQGKQNNTIKELARLKDTACRRESGLFIAEGEHLAMEAVKCNISEYLVILNEHEKKYEELIQKSALADNNILIVTKELIQKLSDTKTPQGIFAICRIKEKTAKAFDKIVALNAVQDPGNVGTILRSLDSAGFDALVIDSKCADPYSQKAIRSSMGSIFRIPIIRVDNLPDYLSKLKGFEVLAASLDGDDFYKAKFSTKKLCVLIGNEGAGLEEEIKKIATRKIRLPMLGGAESLNAACALSIIAYDIIRREISEEKC